jgi:hypothetical protein
MHRIHGQYINESDFCAEGTEEQRKAAYQKFINQYIALLYEPLDEEYEEARYFTEGFEDGIFSKIKYSRRGANRKIANIEVKKAV